MSQVTPPIGMVDQLEATPRAQTPFEQAVLAFALNTGPQDAEVLARVMDPKAREAYAKAEAEQRAQDWPHLGLYRGEDAEDATAERPRVVFIGDSITEMWRYGDPELFSKGILGRGISGQTSPQILIRFYPDVVALKPAAVHILCGGNDIAGNTGPTTPQDFKNNIVAMLDIAEVNRIKVLLGSITPAAQFSQRPEVKPVARIAELNEWLHQIASERGAVFVNYFSALAAADRSMRADYANDGVHPNAAGYSVMRPLALAAIDQVLESV
jgi:lysophospholipase L1-like esterase